MGAIDNILAGQDFYSGRKTTVPVAPVAFDSDLSRTSLQGSSAATGTAMNRRNSDEGGASGTAMNRRNSDEGFATGAQGSSPAAVQKRGSEGVAGSSRGLSYEELFDKYFPDRPETKEEQAKREKKERRDAAFAAIGDGIGALANLFFTSQYAPNMWDASKSRSAMLRARWDKERQERDANRRAWFEGYIRSRAMDRAEAKEERNWRHGLEREKLADERAERQEARQKALADLDEMLRKNQITAAEYKAEQERIKAVFAEQNEILDLEYKKAGIEQREAAAGASKASASASYAKAEETRNGGSGTKRTLRIGENVFRYGSPEDYDRAVEGYAKDFGVRLYITYPDGKDSYGRPKYVTKRKPTSQIAAEVEDKAAGGKTGEAFNPEDYRRGKSSSTTSAPSTLPPLN